MKRILVALLPLLAITGCSGHGGAIILGLSQPTAEYAGYYYAVQEGMYESAGIDLRIHNLPGVSPVDALVDGSASVVVTTIADAAAARDRGVDLVNIFQSAQVSGLTLICKEDFDELKALDGTKVAYLEKDRTEGVCKALSTLKDIDIEWVAVNSCESFSDSIFSAIAVLEQRDYYKVTQGEGEYSIYSFRGMGFDIPEDGLYCLENYYKSNRKALKEFAAVSADAWNAVAEDESLGYIATVNQLLENDEATLKYQFWTLHETLSNQIDPVYSQRTFVLDPSTMKASSDILSRAGVISSDVSLLP